MVLYQPVKPEIHFTEATAARAPLCLPLHELARPRLQPVSDTHDSRLWNEYVHCYHYLGHKPLPGVQQRYFATIDGQIVALLGFGPQPGKPLPVMNSSAGVRAAEKPNLPLVTNNVRFLNLPWVQCTNLASYLLAKVARELPQQWYSRYRIRPVLLETFVEQRFRGTCYRAANWIHVGQTKGRGKCSVSTKPTLPTKDIWLYPLCRDFRQILNS